MHLVELVVPGIIGAGLALFGVWLTNKYNAATNAANRLHQLDVERIKDEIAAEAKSRDNRWAFRKDVYVKPITSTSNLALRVSALATTTSNIRHRSQEPQPALELSLNQTLNELLRCQQDFFTQACLAPLAMADGITSVVQAPVITLKDLNPS